MLICTYIYAHVHMSIHGHCCWDDCFRMTFWKLNRYPSVGFSFWCQLKPMGRVPTRMARAHVRGVKAWGFRPDFGGQQMLVRRSFASRDFFVIWFKQVLKPRSYRTPPLPSHWYALTRWACSLVWALCGHSHGMYLRQVQGVSLEQQNHLATSRLQVSDEEKRHLEKAQLLGTL